MHTKSRIRLYNGPRRLTLIVLAIVAAPLVLANLSPSDDWVEANPTTAELEYGWPFSWYWCGWQSDPNKLNSTIFVLTRCSAPRLTMNLGAWAILLLTITLLCEKLLRRFPLRFRWSLRTMFAGVGLLALACAWFTALRNRANLQDPLIARIEAQGGGVWFERWGPRWFDLFGADRYRRRIVGAKLCAGDTGIGEEIDEGVDEGVDEILRPLADLPGLTFLLLECNEVGPTMAAALSGMKQLRFLRLKGDLSDESVVPLSGLTGLQVLDLHGTRVTDGGLANLAGLENLEALDLADTVVLGHGLGHLAKLEKLRVLDLSNCKIAYSTLANLPPLPRLEALDLSGAMLNNDELCSVAVLPLLKTLDITSTLITPDGLLALAAFQSIEELRIDNEVVSAESLESLLAVGRLRILHIDPAPFRTQLYRIEETTSLPLENDDHIVVWETEFDDCCRALEALRRGKPGLVIDNGQTHVDELHRWRKWQLDESPVPADREWQPTW